MRAEYDHDNNRVVMVEMEDGRKVATNNPRILGSQTEWLPVQVTYPVGYTPRFGNLLNSHSVEYAYDPDQNRIVVKYPEADFSPEKVRQELTSIVKHSAQQMLERTDWMLIRQMDTGQEVPEEVKQERQSIRDKASRYESDITGLSDEELVDYQITFTTDSPKAKAEKPVESVEGGDGSPWMTDASGPDEQGSQVRPATKDELNPEHVRAVRQSAPFSAPKAPTGLPEGGE